MKKYLTIIGSLFAVMIVCLPAAWILDTDMPFSIAAAGTGIISFFGLYDLSLPKPANLQEKEASLRFAIAGSIVIEYLVLVAIVSFFKEGAEELPIITQTLLSNFTAIVGVVIAFYFGSSAYIQTRKNGESNTDNSSG